MAITLVKITPAQHASALEWLATAFPGQTATDSYTAQQAYRIIQHRYDGGWGQFAQDVAEIPFH